ncbi:hypothetical protein FA95DRAFT_331717 [Auriscalpium vulgare]|uniref:Uncharacterized protein n=1 Tax=Auriscalpium vulgare TaxID=40419 RepID=A0ACB8RIT8_9AGAM|nr:hypothetical protein FA95DRAFT_331717 [Auriscalpium vulgare]
MVTSIADIPSEIIEFILIELDPLDVSSFAQTSRRYRTLVYHSPDSHLWRSLYLTQPFDDPRECITPLLHPVPPESVDWKTSLQDIMRARSVADNPMLCKPTETERVLRTLLNMAQHVPPLPSPASSSVSLNLLWLAAILRSGALLSDTLWPATPTEAQLRARLHAYFGLAPRDAHRTSKVASRGYVYDMRHYKFDNDFGPYMTDGSGRVNWVHVQAIHHTLSMHLTDLAEDEEYVYAIYPMSLPYCQPIVPPDLDLSVEKDWAGVEGLWNLAFCFIDHRELLLYNNFSHASDSDPLDPAVFGDPDFREVYRVIPVNFRVVSTDPDSTGRNRGRINFVGEVRDDLTMIGHIELTPDDQVRWHWVSGEDGQAIWSCDGIQVGGVRSRFGILGAWTTVFHDQHDPMGPLWLHKVVDKSEEVPFLDEED